MKKNYKIGTYIYFERYILRIINNYVKEDENKFLESMKSFFINYKQNDILSTNYSKIKYNKSLKYFLNIYIFRAIWERHLYSVVDILMAAKANEVLNFFFRILKESRDIEVFLNNLPPKILVQLALIQNYPISRFFREKISERINKSDKFNPEIMLALLDCPDEELNAQAWSYYNRTGGSLTPKTIVDLLFMKNINIWLEFFNETFNGLEGENYSGFVISLLNKIYSLISEGVELSEEINELLMMSTTKINDIPNIKKAKLLDLSLDLLIHEAKLPDCILKYIKNLIFSITYDDLKDTILELEFDLKINSKISHANEIISLLRGISSNIIPSDSEILDILDYGTPKMVNTLVTIIDKNKDKLLDRYTTLLLLFETDMIALNELAIEIFEMLPEKKNNVILSTLIDSPVKKAYSVALQKLDEIYKDKIPEEIIIRMLEHSSIEVKAYISDKINYVINELSNGNGNSELFVYYTKTLLLLPNLLSKRKDEIYNVIPQFVRRNKEKISEIEDILLKIGGSNIIKDSERALVALAKIKKEVD